MPSRYIAFVSYSHADSLVADRLFRDIESFKVPAHLVGVERDGRVIPNRLRPLFKDREELSTAPDLSSAVNAALCQSDALIVICSPAAAASPWVNAEIRTFKANGGSARVFPVIVEGSELTAFPPALIEELDEVGRVVGIAPEPLAADLARDGLVNTRLKVIAGLLGVPFDELKRRDLARRYRQLLYVTAGAAATIVALAVLSVWAVFAEHEADLRRTQAEDLIEFMIGDLRGRLEPIGKLDLLDDVATEAQAYFETLDESNQSADSLARRGKVAQHLGEVRFRQAELKQALDLFRKALAIQEQAFSRSGAPEIRFHLSQALFWVGYSHWQAGDVDAAVPFLVAYRDHSDALVEADPSNVSWRLERAYARINLGTVHFERRAFADALAAFEAANVHLQAEHQAQRSELNAMNLAHSYAWLGGTHWELGDVVAARDAFAGQVDLVRAQVERDPGNFTALESQAGALHQLGLAEWRMGNVDHASAVLKEAMVLAERLIEREPANFLWQLTYAKSHAHFALTIGNPGGALKHLLIAEKSFPEFDSTYRQNLALDRAELLNNIALALLSLGRSSEALAWAERADAVATADARVNGRQTSARIQSLLIRQCIEPTEVLREQLVRLSEAWPGPRDYRRPGSGVIRSWLGGTPVENNQAKPRQDRLVLEAWTRCRSGVARPANIT